MFTICVQIYTELCYENKHASKPLRIRGGHMEKLQKGDKEFI